MKKIKYFIIPIFFVLFLSNLCSCANKKFANFIEDKNYEDAYLHLSNTKRNLNSRLLAFSGMAFEDGDYELGIDYLTNIGFTSNIHFDNNGGKLDIESKKITSKQINCYIDEVPVYFENTFLGWSITNYNFNIEEKQADIYLKANWSLKKYKIIYDLGGGNFNSISESDIIETYSCEDTYSIPNPERKGYTFVGWDGFSLSRTSTDFTIPFGTTGDKLVTAIWQANNYRIMLDSNGGYCDKKFVDIDFDSKVTLPIPTFNGYDFEGWYDSDSNKYDSETYINSNDIYLKALWKLHQYNINYSLNGGTNNQNNPHEYNIKSNNIILQEPQKEGYTFIGWTTSSNLNPTKDLSINSGSTGDLSLVANWKANTYNVIIDLNGGSSNKLTYTFTFDDNYEIINPTRIGYTFDDFTYDENQHLLSSGKWNVSKDVTIKCNWIANGDTKYQVNSYIENLDGKGYTKYSTIYKTGMTDSNITVFPENITGFSPIDLNKNITINAVDMTIVDFYYLRNSYTISFVTNGGTSIESASYKYEEQIPSTLVAIRTGYTFAGWYSDDKQTTLFDKMPASNKTVYAYYSEETKASYFNYSFDGEEVTITKGAGLSGAVVVPEYIAGKFVTKVGNSAFENCSEITEISLPISIDELGSAAFKGCSSLVKINGTSNLSLVNDSTFEGCSSLTYFSDLSNVTSIGNNAFKGCLTLTTITISDLLTSIGNYAFENCVMLLQTPDLTNVTSIGDYAFKGCTLLSEIKSIDGCATFGEGIFTACENIAKITLSFRENIEQFYVSSFFKGSADLSKYYGVTGKNGSTYYIPKRLTEIEYDATSKTPDYFLYGLTSITKVTDKSASATKIGKHAFDGCINLADYTSSNSSVSFVDEYAFQNCSSLTAMPEFQLEEVKKYAFANCSSLLVAPSLENADYIGDYAFSGCSLIASIKVPNASYMGLNSLYGCSSLTELEVPFVGTTINSSEAFGVIFGTNLYDNSYAATQLSKNYYVPNNLRKLSLGGLEIKSDTIVNLDSITNLIVSDSVETIGSGAFKGLSSLESITVPFVGMQENSTYLTERTFGYIFGESHNTNSCSGNKTSGGTTYQGYCDNYSYNLYLYYVYYIPSTLVDVTITRQTKIPGNAFYNCDCIKSVTIPTGAEQIGPYAFYNCSNLVRFNGAADGEFNIPLGITEINDYTFYNCSSAVEVSLSDDVSRIGDYAFYGCSLISSFNSSNECEINIPESCQYVGASSFDGMGLITNLIVSDSVETIGSGAFKGLSSLESITVPFVGMQENSTYLTERTFGYIFGESHNTNSCSGNKTSGGTTYQGYCDNYSYNLYLYYVYYIPSTLVDVTITRQTKIPGNAFYNCDCINTIHLVNCIDSIGENAFFNCEARVDYLISPLVSGAWDGASIATSYHGGTGTQAEPYQIFSAKEFVYFLNQINNGENYDGAYFTLTSNINLGGYAINATTSTDSASFKGVFDGSSHKVFNFAITSSDGSYNGLFAYVDGTIKNIGFETSMIITTTKTTDVYVGLIVGKLNGSLENVYAVGHLTSTSLRTSYVGGLVGYNNGSILNSYANVDVVATSTNQKCYAAGLVGFNDGSITGSFAYGNVSAKGYVESYSYASGLVAAEGTNSVITSCFRYIGQAITKFGSSSTSYNDIGVMASLEDIISYCKANWNGSVWSYNKALPSF